MFASGGWLFDLGGGVDGHFDDRAERGRVISGGATPHETITDVGSGAHLVVPQIRADRPAIGEPTSLCEVDTAAQWLERAL